MREYGAMIFGGLIAFSVIGLFGAAAYYNSVGLGILAFAYAVCVVAGTLILLSALNGP